MGILGVLRQMAAALGWPSHRGLSPLQLGDRLLAEGKVREALAAFLRHAEQYPADAADAYCRAAKCCLRVRHQDLPREVVRGKTLAAASSRDAAEQLFRKALAIKPKHFEALIGLSELVPPRSAERLHLLERAIIARPHSPTLLAIGDFYRDVLNEPLRAYHYYQRAQQQSPREREAYRRLAEVCRLLGRENEAQHWLNELENLSRRLDEVYEQQ